MKNSKLNTLFVFSTFCICILVICYTASRIDNDVAVDNLIQQDDLVLILDAGHGGIDGGCSTASGNTEKDINLNILLSVRDLGTMFGFTVETTRDSDKSIHDKGIVGIRNQKISDMENRLELFNKYDNAICVSIHQNTYSDPIFNGAQMFYSEKNSASHQLASLIQQKFVNNLQPDNKREIKMCGSELYLCYNCNNPAVMVECGFLSNPQEAVMLIDKAYQKKVAFTIFSGINEFANT